MRPQVRKPGPQSARTSVDPVDYELWRKLMKYPYYGFHEIAQLLGVSKQQAYLMLDRKGAPDPLEPRLAMGRMFDGPKIRKHFKSRLDVRRDEYTAG